MVIILHLPRWLSGKESTYQCRRGGLDPWVRKIPWRRKWQPAWRIPWTENPGRLQSMELQRVRDELATEHSRRDHLTQTDVRIPGPGPPFMLYPGHPSL